MNILASRVARELNIRNAYSNIPIFDEKEAIIPGGIPVVEPLKKDSVVKNHENSRCGSERHDLCRRLDLVPHSI
jgi:hypothetical protein